MINFLKSEMMHYFVGGFAIGAIALFTLQPNDAYAQTPAQAVTQHLSGQILV